MEKHTDRILWSIFVLAIGVSLFIFGKPALANLTNHVLHHDDLKATMQAPSLTSLNMARISAVNNDVGVSKHAYILASTNGITDDDAWSGHPEISFPHGVQTTPIPYGSYLKAIMKIKVDKPVTVTADINNYPLAGTSVWSPSGNDNDDHSTRVFTVDGKRATKFGYYDFFERMTLTPNTWHTLEIDYDNSNDKNTSKAALYDRSYLKFWNSNDNDVSMQTKDAIFAVDAIKYR